MLLRPHVGLLQTKEWDSCGCRAPDALQGADVAQLAPMILGSIDEKDAAVHPAMWDMLLSFVRSHPAAWGAVNARKAILPRLMALLRCTTHPSGTMFCLLAYTCAAVSSRRHHVC